MDDVTTFWSERLIEFDFSNSTAGLGKMFRRDRGKLHYMAAAVLATRLY